MSTVNISCIFCQNDALSIKNDDDLRTTNISQVVAEYLCPVLDPWI